jgi:hypothetical protein
MDNNDIILYPLDWKFVAEGNRHIVCQYVDTSNILNHYNDYIIRLSKLEEIANNNNNNNNNVDIIKYKDDTTSILDYIDIVMSPW